MHVICHWNYHRGEINTMICELNGSPVATDLLAHEDRVKDSREEMLDGFVNEDLQVVGLRKPILNTTVYNQ